MNIRKIKKSVSTKHWLVCILSLGLFSSYGQNSYVEEIEKHRDAYKIDFIESEGSPLTKEDLQYLDFFEVDEVYRVLCKFKSAKKGEPFELPTSSGNTKVYQVFCKLKFKIRGKKYKLNVYRSLALMKNPLYRDYLFIPFNDGTNTEETYGGGRYLDLRMAELEKDEIILDFNKAYNPYCAFSLGYSCPIPPVENHLKVRILAGEKNYLGEYKE